MLENFVAPYDAHVVALLNQAGMVTLGKTNMDEFAMGSSNESSHFGPVSNPWNMDKVSEVHLAGSAAAVAAGLVACATGTDTGGSIRQPAALCGINRPKPTYGRISRYGMIAFASSLDQAGPMTCDAEDAALMLSAMAGFDSKDSANQCAAPGRLLADFAEHGIPDLERPLKIGLPQEYYADLSNGGIIEAVQKTLAQQGHELVDVSLPHTQAVIPVYYVIALRRSLD